MDFYWNISIDFEAASSFFELKKKTTTNKKILQERQI